MFETIILSVAHFDLGSIFSVFDISALGNAVNYFASIDFASIFGAFHSGIGNLALNAGGDRPVVAMGQDGYTVVKIAQDAWAIYRSGGPVFRVIAPTAAAAVAIYCGLKWPSKKEDKDDK